MIDARDYRRIIQIERQNYSDAFEFWEEGIEKKWSFDDEDFVWFVEKEKNALSEVRFCRDANVLA